MRRDVEGGGVLSRRRKGDPVSGWINLDKPFDLGSTQAVSRVRRAFNAQKAGHAGTLDPLASGILPIALGEATKTVPFLMDADKTYRFTIRWGDGDRDPGPRGRGHRHLRSSPDRRGSVTAALGAFVGEISQVPPAYSAVRVDGERAYDLAREGTVLELEARTVVIHEARLIATPDADHSTLEIVCGKGTYVRALARDLALALGTRGHVAELRRTRVGGFDRRRGDTLEKLEDLCHRGQLLEALLPVETALDDIPELAVTTEDAFRLSQGRSIVLLPRQVETLKATLGSARIVSAHDGKRMVALCEMRAGRLNPTRVFHP